MFTALTIPPIQIYIFEYIQIYTQNYDLFSYYGMCPYDDMSCVGRLIVKVDPESRQWQKMIAVDDTFAEGETSYWCVTDDIMEVGYEWNGKFNSAWGVEMKMW